MFSKWILHHECTENFSCMHHQTHPHVHACTHKHTCTRTHAHASSPTPYLCERLGLGSHNVLKAAQLARDFLRALDPFLEAAQVDIPEGAQAQTRGDQFVAFLPLTMADSADVLAL